MRFRIENMECGGCVRGVTRAIHTVDPEATVMADPETRMVEIGSARAAADLAAALEAAGFPAIAEREGA